MGNMTYCKKYLKAQQSLANWVTFLKNTAVGKGTALWETGVYGNYSSC